MAHSNDSRPPVPKARLSGIEAKGRVPSIYCLHALASAYDCNICKLLAFLPVGSIVSANAIGLMLQHCSYDTAQIGAQNHPTVQARSVPAAA